MDEDALIQRARGGDAEARTTIAQRASLRTARLILGDSAVDRFSALRDLARADGPAPGLGLLLAAIGRDGDAALRQAAEIAYRAGTERWGAEERDAIERFAAAHGTALGAALAVELVEWAARYPGEHAGVRAGAAAALAATELGGLGGPSGLEEVRWRTGFELFVAGGGELVERWSASPVQGPLIARALLSAHARRRTANAGSVVPVLDAIWARTSSRPTWAASLAEATGQQRGMSGRDEIAAWGWDRFCAQPSERIDLYAAFRPWRDHLIELRNAMPGATRPAGASAIEHLALWGGLDTEQLSNAVDEATRLASDRDWPELVDVTFDLAGRAPLVLRWHALAGICRISHAVTNAARGEHPSAGIEAASDRLIARSEAVCTALRGEGALLDQIVANRVEDLETNVRLIREARERLRERTDDAARRAEEHRRQLEAANAARREAEEARRSADAARQLALAQLRAHLGTPPVLPADPIDDELFFSALPAARTLGEYARLFRRLTQEPNGVQSLLAEGVPLEMIAVINQTWSQLFAQRPELALRFSALISAPSA